MADGNHAATPDTPPRSRLDPSTLGTIYCILSAIFYTLMGICQRELSKDCDPVWGTLVGIILISYGGSADEPAEAIAVPQETMS